MTLQPSDANFESDPEFDALFEDLIAAMESLGSAAAQFAEILPQERRETFFRLMMALNLSERNPILPILVGLQLYGEYLNRLMSAVLRRLPEALRTSGDDAANRALVAYGQIQTGLETLITKATTQADRIDSVPSRIEEIRKQWSTDAKALLPDLKAAFDAAKKDAVAAYKAETDTIAEGALKDWADNYNQALRECLGNVWKMSSLAIGLGGLAIGVAAYFGGVQQGRAAAIQDSYKAFGGVESYTYAKSLMRRGDNVRRFVKCGNEGNDKCTVWIKDPPQQ